MDPNEDDERPFLYLENAVAELRKGLKVKQEIASDEQDSRKNEWMVDLVEVKKEEESSDESGVQESRNGDLPMPKDDDACEANLSHDGSRFRCQHPGCARSFKHKRNLTKHQNVHTTKFQCQFCSKCFCNTTELIRHEPVHTGERPFACNWPGCSGNFKWELQLQRHREMVHLNKRPFQCNKDDCGKRFKAKHALQEHLNAVHLSLRPFQCQECQKRFKSSRSMKLHAPVHSDDHPFACDWPGCCDTFKWESQRNIHIEKVHSDGRPFVCNWIECLKRFKRKVELRQHVNQVHSDEHSFQRNENGCGNNDLTDQLKQGKNVRKFRCEEQGCGKSFKIMDQLQRHIKTAHTISDRLLQCQVPGCGQLFKLNDIHIHFKEVQVKLEMPL